MLLKLTTFSDSCQVLKGMNEKGMVFSEGKWEATEREKRNPVKF